MGKLEGKSRAGHCGSSGIGLATAKQFVNEGAYVFITGRRQPELDAAVKDIGRNITAVQFWLASSVMNTYAPSFTNCFAVARPMPLLPPVTSATFPSSCPSLLLLTRSILAAHSGSRVKILSNFIVQILCDLESFRVFVRRDQACLAIVG